MSLKALSDYTFYSRYSHYLPEKKRRETWPEAVKRVFDMHRKKYAKEIEASKELEEAIDFAESQQLKKRVLAAQRTLQFGGDAIFKHELKTFNCLTTYIDRTRVFQECMYSLLCGCGIGFSVQKQHVAKLGKFVFPNYSKSKTFVIEDSIEGWADAVGVLINSWLEKPEEFKEYNGVKVEFDFSKIRPEGSLIAGKFKAPGPTGLKNSLQKIGSLLEKKFNDTRGGYISPINAYDIIMHISDAVLSGGVRRSATLCMFSHDDEEMMKAKTGDWFVKNPQRARSNNSATLLKGEVTRKEFETLMSSTKTWGEPGCVWVDNKGIVYNPCCIGKESLIPTKDGLVTPLNQTESVVVNSEEKFTNTGFFSNGMKDVFKFELENGMELNLTEDHRVLTKKGVFKPIITVFNDGDEIAVNQNLDVDFVINQNSKDFKLGYLLGSFVGDGSVTRRPKKGRVSAAALTFWGDNNMFYKNTCYQFLEDLGMNRKKMSQDFLENQKPTTRNRGSLESVELLNAAITKKIFNPETFVKELNYESLVGSYDYVSGLLSGYFDADGCVSIKAINFSSSNLQNLKLVQSAFNAFGISSRISLSRKGQIRRFPFSKKGEKKRTKEYKTKTEYILFIHKHSLGNFEKHIKLLNKNKQRKLKRLIDNSFERSVVKKVLYSKIKKITPMGKQTVYDISVPEGNRFSCNGCVVHNCEIGMIPALDGESGWQSCNLTEINGKYCDSEENFLKLCKASAIIGTLQAGYTNLKYLNEVSKKIFEKEALLGCSITGMMDNPEILFDPEIQKKGAQLILKENERIAKLIGINPCARATCVKPAGSTSCVLGTSSGIHPHHAKKYIRRAQVNKEEFCGQIFAEENPLAVEKSVWSSNGTDNVISFLCEVPPGAVIKNQLSALELLERVKLTQQNWVEYGTRPERCIDPCIRHNVSNTITVKDDEWPDVEKFIFDNQKHFAGISLLSASGDLDYAQAPFSTVLTPNELVKEYGDASIFASGLVVDGLHAFDDNLWKACDTVLGHGEEIPKKMSEPHYPKTRNYKDLAGYFEQKDKYDGWWQKTDWIRRVNQFAERYFNKDVRKATYCLKHVSLWKRWVDLKREYKDIDWESVIEERRELVDAGSLAAQSCSGNKCEINI